MCSKSINYNNFHGHQLKQLRWWLSWRLWLLLRLLLTPIPLLLQRYPIQLLMWFLLVFFSRIYSWNIFKEKAPAEVVEASEEAMEAAAEEKPGTLLPSIQNSNWHPVPQRSLWRRRTALQFQWKPSLTFLLLQWLKLKLHQSSGTIARLNYPPTCASCHCLTLA